MQQSSCNYTTYWCGHNVGRRQKNDGPLANRIAARESGKAPNSSICSSSFCSSSLCGSDFRSFRRGWKELRRRQDTEALCQAGGLRHSDWNPTAPRYRFTGPSRRAKALGLKQGNHTLRRRGMKSRARGPRAKPVWAHNSGGRSASSGTEAPHHESKPRRALARKDTQQVIW